jgi:hypothetical protein
MDGFKRWAPFVGTVITVVCAFLKAMGYTEAADAILGVVALILPATDTPTGALATTAAVSAVGLVVQLVSRFNKAREQKDTITIPVR